VRAPCALTMMASVATLRFARFLREPGLTPPVSSVQKPNTPGFFFCSAVEGLQQRRPQPNRSVNRPGSVTFFVDGNNWYHGLKSIGVRDQRCLSFAKIATKLAGARVWNELRYYIGQVSQTGNSRLYADQRRLLAQQRKLDPRFSIHFGRIEQRNEQNQAAKELRAYLAALTARKVDLDPRVRTDLSDLAARHERSIFWVEKAVDVMLAVDLVVLAERDEFETAYVLSADGDYTHAVEFARSRNKKVFAVSARYGAQLAKVADTFIRIDRQWLADCYV
jgi:uncharacterized LabA/DUF88 family protein